MRIPFNWLKEYVAIDVTPKKLADLLIMSGTEVEILSDIEGDFENIVVGEIVEILPHPNADRLQVTKTKVGSETLQIVCGATNIEVGQKVPVALVGAIFGEIQIKEAEIRGVKSYGMLCSESELGISDDHSGIMILDPRVSVGENVADALGSQEPIFEAEITPNRGDLLSMIGTSREVSAILNKKVILPNVSVKESRERAKDLISIDIQDKEICPRYIARVIKNVNVAPSPRWLQDRLASSGVRSINNIVDVSNYVMLEYGQPLHTFDLDKIKGEEPAANDQSPKRIFVRRAEDGETIKTLDGFDRKLTTEDLVISDVEKAIAIAGVMGGENSEVTSDTRTIVLESANFSPTNIRKTALRLALRSEASARFEKGLPLYLQEEAVDRAASLLADLSGGEVCEGKVDEGQRADVKKEIELRMERVKDFLGIDVGEDKSIKILDGLGFVAKKDKGRLRVEVPSWRLDVLREEDLFEEIARMHGYDHIPTTLPEGEMPYPEKNILLDNIANIQKMLAGMGFRECYSYSFVDSNKSIFLKKEGDNTIIANPISSDQVVMRQDHLKSLLQVAGENKGQKNIKIFEIAAVYKEGKEPTKLSSLVVTKSKVDHSALYEAKGVVETIFEKLSIKDISYVDESLDCFSSASNILIEGQQVGILGILKADIGSKYKISKNEIAFFELDFQTMISLAHPKKFSSVSRYPSSGRDLAFVVNEGVKAGEMLKAIENIKSPILKKFSVEDIYRGKGFGEGEKSIALNFVYQHPGRTLTDEEINEDQQSIIVAIEGKFGGKLRSERTD